jgi:peptidoglycan/xylan/chitin deacetylase (PgdA/CDA1 family)
VLELLKKHEAKATFFCVGKQIESYPEIFKKIIAQGHTVGNHTYSHDNWYGFFSTKKVVSDLKKTSDLVKKRYNLQLKLYRPAFGVSNPNIKKAIDQLDLTAIGWNKRSLDTTSLSSEKIISRITNQLKKGDIVLLHDTSDKSLVVLEQLLLFLQKENLKSVTIDTLFNISPYA